MPPIPKALGQAVNNNNKKIPNPLIPSPPNTYLRHKPYGT